MNKIKKSELFLLDLEKNNDTIDSNSPKQTLQKKNTTKFSMSNENEFLFNSRERQKSRKKTTGPQKLPGPIKRIYECKAKSEEKYTGSPAYQIFMARNPELMYTAYRFTGGSWEKKLNKINYITASPESASLRRFKKESYDNFEDVKEKPKMQIHCFEESAKRTAAVANTKKAVFEFEENPSKKSKTYKYLIIFFFLYAKNHKKNY